MQDDASDHLPSVLSRRFYWEPLERLGIEQEHEFVFRNFEKDLKKRHPL